MADSDNTTTLSSVTSGREPQSSLTKDDPQAFTTPVTDDQQLADPALVRSLAWVDAHVAMLASCIRQQQTEERLLDRGALLSVDGAFERGEGADADVGYLDLRTAEQDDADRADALLAEIAATPAQSLAGVIAKLAVIVREAHDNSDLGEFPLPHIRSALADLRRLTQDAICDPPAGWPAGDQSIGSLFEQPASSFAAWRAFDAWSQGDDDAYRAWTDTFKTLQGTSQ
ncbi:hypothetical protein LB543_22125 [Mesorhizobium sp. ESP7-2]|uniref:hypothetical protein n=1 Tax=unclassified Mesorhizobium TaxID=325217 RepID=UPI001CCE3B40|nr:MULTISPECIES: hypothetical protein [unclassified Mesorhizobium]MBZ9673085.1 hypothetical protein [Mesorhizobium sp. ES1-3]MBZ9709424.1 hypothetical protein [Mesorhizobium sp. ESP7-2]